jgi:adenylate cyclase
MSAPDETALESHRREVAVLFCDLRGFTAFSEEVEPEEVMAALAEFHATVGPLINSFAATVGGFTGDGLMVFFNDPLPCPDPAERAVRMAVEMREALLQLQTDWKKRGRQIGFGLGIAQGYATLGQIGFAERIGYTAIGTVCNLAARLCAEAKDGQILISQRIAAAADSIAPLEEIGDLALKGLSQAVAVYNIARN